MFIDKVEEEIKMQQIQSLTPNAIPADIPYWGRAI